MWALFITLHHALSPEVMSKGVTGSAFCCCAKNSVHMYVLRWTYVRTCMPNATIPTHVGVCSNHGQFTGQFMHTYSYIWTDSSCTYISSPHSPPRPSSLSFASASAIAIHIHIQYTPTPPHPHTHILQCYCHSTLTCCISGWVVVMVLCWIY